MSCPCTVILIFLNGLQLAQDCVVGHLLAAARGGVRVFRLERDGHALICGASKGIGRGAARAIAGLGVHMTVLARSESILSDLVGELKTLGARSAGYIVADLDDRASLLAQVDRLMAERGPIHILLNNTGGPAAGSLLEADEEALLHGFSRHVLGAQRLAQRLVPGMSAAGYGRIINILSSSVREPIPGLGVSNLVRAAMASWSKTLSRELPPGVTVNSILPGKIDTGRLTEIKAAFATKAGTTVEAVESQWIDAIPEGRLGTTDEIGGVIAFLASPAGSFVRGVCLPVDGGQLRAI
jgi:3-oxoacyl-[acyl-carrier protein] reductase